jgi:hypothetical protein
VDAATLTRPTVAARLRGLDASLLARAAFVLLCAGFAIGFFVYPTYPVYDSYYALVWGHELLHGHAPIFQGFRYPTEHPLAIGVGAVLSLLGGGADRVWIALMLGSFVALVAGVYRLGRQAATPLVGALAAALLLTRFDYAFLAARGYVDIPYMAMVVWAAVLEASRPRRGTPVFILLALAGLLRPEAWLLAGLYWLWMFPRATWGERVRYALLTASAPVIWAAVDWSVTGDALFSLHYTSSSAEDLGRQRTLAELPGALPLFFVGLVKVPVLVAAVPGLVLSLLMAPRRMAMPLVLLGAGLGTFALIGAAGASVIERYLAVAALSLLVFASVLLTGWTMLRPGRLRTAWGVAGTLVVVVAAVVTLGRLDLSQFSQQLTFRGEAHHDLVRILHEPAVQAGLRCGPLSVPNHKIVPDSRWIAGLPASQVLPRAQDGHANPRRGVALVVDSRFAVFLHAWTSGDDSALIQLPPPGFHRVAVTRFYTAYVRC